MSKISKAEAKLIIYLNNEIAELKSLNEELVKRNDIYKVALLSISKNSCCDQCQEAKLVAQKALTQDSAKSGGNKS